MSDDYAHQTQQTLTGGEATPVQCEFYDPCKSDALYIAEILHYGFGELPVRMCRTCAEEHAEEEGVKFGDDIQRLKPADRYKSADEAGVSIYVVSARFDGDPHPHVELVTADEDEADELMDQLQNPVRPPYPLAWDKSEHKVDL